MPDIRLAVTGGRDAWCEWLVEFHLRRIRPAVVIHGKARGVDMTADRVARRLGIEVIGFDAHWMRFGNGAGPERNQRMIDEGKPTHGLALPSPFSSGTWDMVMRLTRAGVPTEIFCAECGGTLGQRRGACLFC